MAGTDLAAMLAFFKAMANESRLRIVALLAERERSVQELAELLELKEPTVSHHLAALKRLGVVRARADGVTHWHVLQVETLTRLNRALVDREAVSELARQVTGDPRHAGGWEAKVLAALTGADGRLAAIPASPRKRAIALGWLAQGFEPGRDYSEAEVDEVLARRCPDAPLARRELLGCGRIVRENGRYRMIGGENFREPNRPLPR